MNAAHFALPALNDARAFRIVNDVFAHAKASGRIPADVLNGWVNAALAWVTDSPDLSKSVDHESREVRSAAFWGSEGKIPSDILEAARHNRRWSVA